MSQILQWLLPWNFSPWVQVLVWGSVLLYLRGLYRTSTHISGWRSFSFLLGVLLMYAVSQTYLDYLARYMFFMHRAQHLVLHHLAAFLIILAAPASVLRAGLPAQLGQRPLPAWMTRLYRLLQNPLIASLLFVGLVYLWLWPPIHFDAAFNARLYGLMNWSMALDGLLFWQLMLNHGPPGITPRLSYGKRCMIMALIVPPQIALGAYITLVPHELYPAYSICGRAWPFSPLVDQQIGGLLTWIPPAMMSLVGILVVLRFMAVERRILDLRRS